MVHRSLKQSDPKTASAFQLAPQGRVGFASGHATRAIARHPPVIDQRNILQDRMVRAFAAAGLSTPPSCARIRPMPGGYAHSRKPVWFSVFVIAHG